jgi:molybdate transport system permease protein
VSRGQAFTAALGLALGLAVAFLLLPVAAIFLRVSPVDLVSQLGDRAARDALLVSLKTNAIAEAAILLVGTPAAYLLATRRFRGRAAVVTLIELPLVMPPAVAGIALLAAFGRLGLLGGALDAVGIDLAFNQLAVVLAITFVASPFYVRQAIAAFGAVDGTLLDAARTLGASRARVFARVALPLAASGLAAGAALAFARGLGEFGATIMFAGSLQGRTQTLPLAIYARFGTDFHLALSLGALLVVVSAALLLTLKLIPGWTRSGSTWFFRAAPSTSS